MNRTATITETVTLEVITCCVCGVPFAMSTPFITKLRETQQTFYCPNGHQQGFYGPNEADRLKEDLAALQRQLRVKEVELADERTLREQTRRQLTAAKEQLTKTKNRIAAGVCPCCNRYFAHLHRHMRSQHPDYEQSDDPGAESNE